MSTKQEKKKWLMRCLAAGAVLAVSGCGQLSGVSFTGKLWGGEYDCTRFHGPATNALPALYHTADGGDVLVCYEEGREKNQASRERAYLLYQNRRAIESGGKPAFVNPAAASGLTPIPVARGDFNDADGKDETLRAFLNEDGRHFTLVSRGRELGAFELPVYWTGDKMFKRATLTPLAVMGDGVVVSAVAVGYAAPIALYGMCQSGVAIRSPWKF